MRQDGHTREGEKLRRYTQHLLRDVEALERVLERGLLETEAERRIGAEQELFLVDRNGRPAPVNEAVLARSEDPRLVAELGRFNLELNAHPVPYGGRCVRLLHAQLDELIEMVRRLAREEDASILLAGILPTARRSDLTLENMTPRARYRGLNRALSRLRGGTFRFYILGTDELQLEHDSMMVEAANTSFQVHFQVGSEEFARLYNVAQVVTGPLLAAATNSPVLFGRRLWHETRIALFQQSVDTRQEKPDLREIRPRVTFGESWVKASVLEIYREDIARFRSLFYEEPEEDPFEALAADRAPELAALQLHNSTVYRWNRPCYGLSEGGRAHLRIENRVLPSGPTLLDEMANATFWFGLLSGVAEEYGDVRRHMDFDLARGNFVAAARLGAGAQLAWLDGEEHPARQLVLERLLPLAHEGLRASDMDPEDSARFLDVIERRMRTGQTGSVWILRSLAEMSRESSTSEERLRALTAAMLARQKEGLPAHEWSPARLEEGGGWQPGYLRLDGFMSTDLLTVNEDEAVELVANLMAWHRVRYVPVEDAEHRLVGLVSDRSLLRFLTSDERRRKDGPVPVSAVMETELITATPETSTLEAIRLMRGERVPCLPVIRDGRLVGLVTEGSFLDIAAQLMEQRLEEASSE